MSAHSNRIILFLTRAASWLLIGALALSLVACANGSDGQTRLPPAATGAAASPSDPTPAGVATSSPSSDTLHIGLPGTRDERFTVSYADEASRALMLDPASVIYEDVFYFDAERRLYRSGPIREVIRSGAEMTLLLRDHVIFHDGNPLRGEDVAASILAVRDGDDDDALRLKERILSVTSHDVGSVDLTLSGDRLSAAAAAIDALTAVPVRSRRDLASETSPGDVRTRIGTGPYRFLQEDAFGLTLALSDNWRRRAETYGDKADDLPPYLYYPAYALDSLAQRAFFRGDTDMLIGRETPLAPVASDTSLENSFYLRCDNEIVAGLLIHPGRGPLSDRRARLLLNAILPVEEAGALLFPDGLAPDPRCRLTRPSATVRPFEDTAYETLVSDSPEALIDALKWSYHPETGQLEDRAGHPISLTLTYPLGDPAVADACDHLASAARAYGIELKTEGVNETIWAQRLSEQSYDLIYFASRPDETPADILTRLFACPYASSDATKGPAADFAALCDQYASAIASLDSLSETEAALNASLITNMLVIPLGSRRDVAAVGRTLHFPSDTLRRYLPPVTPVEDGD